MKLNINTIVSVVIYCVQSDLWIIKSINCKLDIVLFEFVKFFTDQLNNMHLKMMIVYQPPPKSTSKA